MENHSNGQDGQLSSWKAIAEYLKCRPRTCIRWEKTLGLPVHRLEGSQRSRVFAYKHELDDWLQKKLRNGGAKELEPGGEPGLKARRKRFWIAIGATAIILAFVVVYFVAGVPKEKPLKIVVPPPTADGTPRSSGLMDMYPGDIITTEFLPQGKLRVWRRKNETAFFESWGMGPLRHTSLAVGDLDRDADQEIVAPGYCRDFIEQNGRTTSRIRFFLNAYKKGVSDWWKTTFYDKAQCVYEKDDFEFSDIAMADLDGVASNEIALVTAFGLSVYRYDPESQVIKLIAQTDAFKNVPTLHLRGVAAGDADGDGVSEILVAGNEWKDDAEVVNKAWLVALDLKAGQLSFSRAVPLSGNVSIQSLRLGDVIAGGNLEIVFPLYRRTDHGWSTFVTGCDLNKGSVFETLIDQSLEDFYSPLHIAVGDLASQPGDEIVVARSDPNELILGYWNGRQLVLGPRYPLAAKAELAGVFVNPAKSSANSLGRIMAVGSIKVPGEAGTN